MGPVVPALRFRQDEADSNVLTPGERAIVDAVVAFYGPHHGQALAKRSHDEAPWQEARGGLPESASCNSEITHESMRRFYTRAAIGGEGPTRRAVQAVASDDEVRAVAEANAERWRGTLDLLSR